MYISIFGILIVILCILVYLKASGRSVVFKSDYKPLIRDEDNIKCALYRLSAEKYLIVLTDISGGKVEGYYIDLSLRKIGYANFSPKTYITFNSYCAIVDETVFEGYSELYELDADFRKESDGWIIDLKGPSKNAINSEPGAEEFYKESTIYNKTIALKE